MNIHQDLSLPAVVDSASLPWVATSQPGVQRRMLERQGGEIARATTIVRYQPGSKFHAHAHDRGEEFLVLDGVFEDESGAFPAGSYVRNPPGSTHRPSSPEGCVIFVKLQQFATGDGATVRLNTEQMSWSSEGAGEGVGVERKRLHHYRGQQVSLIRLAPGSTLPGLEFVVGEELLVLEGGFETAQGAYPKGTWLRHPPGPTADRVTTKGCLLYLKTGHLQDVAVPCGNGVSRQRAA